MDHAIDVMPVGNAIQKIDITPAHAGTMRVADDEYTGHAISDNMNP